MGKKKSVVLITLITIVVFVLCALVAFPSIPLDKLGIKKWNSIALQYDLGAEFEGGYYAYYYPNGVLTETKYNNNVAALEGTEKDEYVASYKQYEKDGKGTSLYLSTNEDYCIWTDDGKVSEGFKTAFDKAVKVVTDRFATRAAKSGSTYRVSVVDDYAIRVELSASENSDNQSSANYAASTFTSFSNVGGLTFKMGDKVVEQLEGDEAKITDVIKKVSVKTQYERAWIRITFTDAGKAMLKAFKNNTDENVESLDLYMGDESLLQITNDFITSRNEVEQPVAFEQEVLNAETLCVQINSAMENGGIYINDNLATPFGLQAPSSVEIRTYGPISGDTLVWVYVGILATILLLSVLAIVMMGGFGVMNLYTTLTYTVIAAICFAFITGGVFVVSLASIFVFLAGLALTNVLNVYIYNAIKAEAAQKKTVQSSVKGGYKKTLWTIVDIYAVLLLGGIAFLIGAASLHTVACQAIICIVTGAFCNLLWGRVINFLLLSASKDKYKHLRLVREDDDDDE